MTVEGENSSDNSSGGKVDASTNEDEPVDVARPNDGGKVGTRTNVVIPKPNPTISQAQSLHDSALNVVEEVEGTKSAAGLETNLTDLVPSIVRTPSTRLREKLMSESGLTNEGLVDVCNESDQSLPKAGNGNATAPAANVICGDLKDCENNDFADASSTFTAAPGNRINKTSVDPLHSNESIPTILAEDGINKPPITTNDVDQCHEELIRSVVPRGNATVRPGAYAVEGINARSSPSLSHLAVPSSHADSEVDVNSPTEALDAFCVEEDEGVVAAAQIVVEDESGRSEDSPKPLVKHKCCLITALAFAAIIAVIVVVLSAVGVVPVNNGNGSKIKNITQDTTLSNLPKALFEETLSLLGPAPGVRYGHRVSFAMQGTRLAISTKEGKSTEAAFVSVYDLNDSQPIQVGQIISGSRGDIVGKLSKNGRRLIVGEGTSDGQYGIDDEIGQVQVFELNSSKRWEQVGQTIYGGRVGSRAGSDVSISSDGNVIAIGAPLHGTLTGGAYFGAGAVRTYISTPSGDWTELGSRISGVNDKERLGWSVALSNDASTLVIGSSWNRTVDESSQSVKLKAGSLSVYEFKEDDMNWVQKGQPVFGVNRNDIFGTRVATNSDGSIVAGASHRNDEAADRAGHVRVYQYSIDRNAWEQMGNSITGKRVAVCAPGAGYCKIYDYVGDDWVLVGGGVVIIDEPGSAYTADVALSQDGYTLAVGSRDHLDERGIVRIFDLPNRLQ